MIVMEKYLTFKKERVGEKINMVVCFNVFEERIYVTDITVGQRFFLA
jgi:hypothetical protein